MKAWSALLLGVALWLPASVMAALPDGYEVRSKLRDTGYVLGDLLVQEVEILTPSGAQLDPRSVPSPGRVSQWMELRLREVDRFSGGVRLRLTYQVFGAVNGAKRVAVPEFQLRFEAAAQTVRVAVPAQPFYLSPVLPAELAAEDRLPRSAMAPVPEAGTEYLLRAAVSLLVGLAAALYLAWRHDRLPFLPRSPGPLTRLKRRMRRLEALPAYPQLLAELQSAFNQSARETLYADTLNVLFYKAPYLQPLESDIRGFFEHAREVFYASRVEPGSWPEGRIIGLCREASDRERGLR